jgi:hypothetical protein
VSFPNCFRDTAIRLYSGLAWAPGVVLPSRHAAPLSAACESEFCRLHSNGCISETVRNSTHVHTKIVLKMTDTMTSQNIDLSSWDNLYSWHFSIFVQVYRTLLLSATPIAANRYYML